MEEEENIDSPNLEYKELQILHGHIYYLSRFSRRAKFKSIRKTKAHLCKNQAVLTFPRDQCRHSSGVSDPCSSRSGSTGSVSYEFPLSKTRITVVHDSTNPAAAFNSSRDVSQFERSTPDTNSRRVSQYERNNSDRNYHCFPHRLGRNIGTLFCKSKMLRLGVLLLVLIIWVGVTYSAIKNQSVGNGARLKQANNTYHPSHKLQESARLNSILVSEFKKAIKTTHTAKEFIRLFAGKDATREQIDRLLGYEQERPYSDRGRFPRTMNVYDDTVSGLDKALLHVREMTSSPLHECKHPRPEIVYIQDNEAKSRVYFPSCTVIHRCRNVTGCCSNASAVCGPKRVKIISKYFVVLDLTEKNPETANLNSKMIEVRQFMNHTECECKEIIKLPGCKKECPHPFQKIRNGLECVCDCRNDQRGCLLIKDGRKPLNEHSLVCIKGRKCQRPNCRYGYFDLNTGFCPLLQLGNQRKNRRRNRRLRGKPF